MPGKAGAWSGQSDIPLSACQRILSKIPSPPRNNNHSRPWSSLPATLPSAPFPSTHFTFFGPLCVCVRTFCVCVCERVCEGAWCESVWTMAGLGSLTWPESDWLDSWVWWGFTPVVHWAISVHRSNQLSSHALKRDHMVNMEPQLTYRCHSTAMNQFYNITILFSCNGGAL